MKSNDVAKLVNQLCANLEAKGAKHQLLVDFVHHFRVMIKSMERLPDGCSVSGSDEAQKLSLTWWNPDKSNLTIEVNELPF